MPSIVGSATSGQRNISYLLSLMLLINLSMSLYQLPLNKVIERRLCRKYYSAKDPRLYPSDGEIEETLCKVDEVQKGLARTLGIMETAWILGDFIMTIPLGFMAEKYGRRAIFMMNLAPRISMLAWTMIVGRFEQTLPTQAIVASPFMSVLGGDCVFNSLVYSLAAELTDIPYLRASYFGYMSSVTYIVALLGPALASATMSVNLWLPFWLAILLLLLASPFVLQLPTSCTLVDHEEQTEPLMSSPLLKAAEPSSIFDSLKKRLGTLHSIVASRPRNFTLLLFSFLLTSLASSDTKLLVQYISKRYSWTFASAGYLLSAKAVVNFFLLAVFIPRMLAGNHSLDTTATLADQANIKYSKACLAVSVLGTLAIACAVSIWMLVPALLIYALGSALPVFTLSLLKSPTVSPRKGNAEGTETQVFAIVMLVKTFGSLIGAPLMATLWLNAISLGGVALGMPYFVSAVCYAVAIVVFTVIRISSTR